MRHYRFAIPVFVLCSVLFAWGQQGAASGATRQYDLPAPSALPVDLEQQGDQYREQKAYADAIEFYRAALAKTKNPPAQASLLNKCGIAELQVQRFKQAQKYFERALKRRPDFAEARNNLAASFFLRKKYSRAIHDYEEALRMAPENASFHSNLGTAFFITKDLNKAIAEYSRALQLDPGIFERRNTMGISAQLSTPENRAQYSFLLARMFAGNGDLDHSLEYLKRAMEEGYKEIGKVYEDNVFTALRQDPRFATLMANRPTSIPE